MTVPIWSVPLCKREVNTIWRDGERYLKGHGRQVLVFDYKLELARSGETDRLTHDSIRVVMGLHEAAPLRLARRGVEGIVRLAALRVVGVVDVLHGVRDAVHGELARRRRDRARRDRAQHEQPEADRERPHAILISATVLPAGMS